MHADEYRRMFELEDRYWWFVARRRLALGLLRRALADPSSLAPAPSSPVPRPSTLPPDPSSLVPRPSSLPRVLDLGCGTGVVLRELGSWANPVGLDMSPLALEFCRRRELRDLVVAKGESIPLSRSVFDAVVALDILEHIPDDAAAFAEIFRILKPGGVLVLSVPAFKTLWGPHDVALMHRRRYRAREVGRRLTEAGFEVERLSYSIFLLFPIVLVVRLVEKFKRGEAEASLPKVPAWFNAWLVRLQDLEAAMIRRVSLPWGSSVVAVARKPKPSPDPQ